jgi:trimeric autotransporter adhesin
VSFRTNLICAIVLCSLAACGSGSNSASTAASAAASDVNAAASAAAPAAASAASAAGSAMSDAAGAAAGAMSAMANKVAAAVPASLHCGAVPPVWVNPKSHAYHEPSDPLYGKTKSGSYMCASAAVAAGYHKAGGGKWRHHKGMKDDMMQGSPAPAAT